MREQGIAGDYAQLESLYIKNVLGIAEDLKVDPIVWQEVFLNDQTLSKNATVHIWTGNTKSLLSEVSLHILTYLFSKCTLSYQSVSVYNGVHAQLSALGITGRGGLSNRWNQET